MLRTMQLTKIEYQQLAAISILDNSVADDIGSLSLGIKQGIFPTEALLNSHPHTIIRENGRQPTSKLRGSSHLQAKPNTSPPNSLTIHPSSTPTHLRSYSYTIISILPTPHIEWMKAQIVLRDAL